MGFLSFPLKGTSVGAIIPFNVTSEKISGVDTANVMLFDKVAEGKFSIPQSAEAAEGNDEFVEWKSNNGTTFRIKKVVSTYDIATSGLTLASSTSGNSGDAYTISLTVNDTPLGATPPATIGYTDFVNSIKAIREKPCLIVLPFGLNVDGELESTVCLIGKLSAAIEHAMGDGTALTTAFTFNGTKIEFDSSQATTITAINSALVDVTPIGRVPVEFLTITATHVDNVLEKGELLFA